MKLKKLMSLGLALVMAAALAVPALAADTDLNAEHGEQKTTFTGGTKVATVKLSAIGSAQGFVFNPYKLAAKMKTDGTLDDSATSGFTTVKDQIISKPFEIQNQTDVPLRMAVTLGAKGSLGTGAPEDAVAIAIVKAAPAATVTAKQAYVYADFAAFDGAAADLEKRPEAWISNQRLVATEATVGDDGWDGTSGGKIEIKNNAGGVYIPAPVNTPTGGSAAQNSIWVKIGGAATATPAENWGGYDKLTVYTSFKFVPQGSTPLYKLYEAHYTAGSDGADPTYTAGVTIGDTTAATGAPTLTVPYQKDGINVAISNPVTSFPLYKTSAKEEQVDGNVEAGYVVTITPPKDSSTGKVTHTIKSVTFYDANNTKLTAPKAATTNSKDKTAPWTFTMPAQNLVIDIEMEAVSIS